MVFYSSKTVGRHSWGHADIKYKDDVWLSQSHYCRKLLFWFKRSAPSAAKSCLPTTIKQRQQYTLKKKMKKKRETIKQEEEEDRFTDDWCIVTSSNKTQVTQVSFRSILLRTVHVAAEIEIGSKSLDHPSRQPRLTGVGVSFNVNGQTCEHGKREVTACSSSAHASSLSSL